MTLRVYFTPSAKADLREARDWYEQDGLGLGNALLNEVLLATNRISKNPDQFAAEYRGVRQCPVRRFPYVVSFRVTESRIEILAILHGHRDPATWTRRM